MKRHISLFSIVSILVLSVWVELSCEKNDSIKPIQTKEDESAQQESENEITFHYIDASNIEAGVETKTSAVTSLSSFYAAATKGSAGSETSKWTSYQFNSDGAGTPTYHGTGAGKWWPDTDESYHFYASNNALTFAAAGTTVSATNSTDVVCAYMPSPTYKTKNTLTFEHIFARIGDVTVSAASGYTISNVSISITPKTGGTYNIRTGSGQTNDTGWSSLTTGSATGIANSTPGTKSNDVWLVPGNYTLTASWRAVRDDYTHDYSNVSASAVIAVQKGKVNSINITLGGNATEITYGVSINAWGSASLSASFPTASVEPCHYQPWCDEDESGWGSWLYPSFRVAIRNKTRIS